MACKKYKMKVPKTLRTKTKKTKKIRRKKK